MTTHLQPSLEHAETGVVRSHWRARHAGCLADAKPRRHGGEPNLARRPEAAPLSQGSILRPPGAIPKDDARGVVREDRPACTLREQGSNRAFTSARGSGEKRRANRGYDGGGMQNDAALCADGHQALPPASTLNQPNLVQAAPPKKSRAQAPSPARRPFSVTSEPTVKAPALPRPLRVRDEAYLIEIMYCECPGTHSTSHPKPAPTAPQVRLRVAGNSPRANASAHSSLGATSER